MEEIIKQLGSALLLTVVIEISIAILLKVRSVYDLIFIFLVNCITNPMVNAAYVFILWSTGIVVGSLFWIIIVLILEISVWLSEAFTFKKLLEYKKMNMFLFSLILNLSSFALGLIIL